MYMKFPLHEPSQDTTPMRKRTGAKHQAHQNFRVQNSVRTQKAHELQILDMMATSLCLN